MKAKRVIRIELTEDEASEIEKALIELDHAASGDGSKKKFDIENFWWSEGACLTDLLRALGGLK